MNITVWSNEVSVWLAIKARKIYLKKPLASKIRFFLSVITMVKPVMFKRYAAKRTGVKGTEFILSMRGTELNLYLVCVERS
jgi:hypothetical protein